MKKIKMGMRWCLVFAVLTLTFAAPETEENALAPSESAFTFHAKAFAAPQEIEKNTLTPNEKEFQEMLSGVTLVGHFTINGSENEGKLREEKYTITKVTKMKDDYWLFAARVQYGGKDVTVPLPLEVKWAGDTPVITLTDMELPNLGTYTARVLIYRDQYAGTWSGGKHGGHLFGRVVKGSEE